jgi:TRAP-type C4-dicarboxylate transport system permease small subunit
MEGFRRAYTTALEWLVIALMAVLAVEVTIGVAARTFGVSFAWYDEIASILLAWLTFYGSALASARRAHIGCPELVAIMPPRLRLAVRVVAEVFTIGFFLVLGWMGYAVLGVLETDHLVSVPEIPVSWVQSVVPFSCALIVAAELLTLPKVLSEALLPPAVTGGASH